MGLANSSLRGACSDVRGMDQNRVLRLTRFTVDSVLIAKANRSVILVQVQISVSCLEQTEVFLETLENLDISSLTWTHIASQMDRMA